MEARSLKQKQMASAKATKHNNLNALADIQSSYEQRFNCVICLCPKLKMIYGYCQHRICVDCLYNEDNIRRQSMDKCPTCQKEEAFPVLRPDVPEDSIELQKCLGVRSCSNIGCRIELWEWELEEHLLICPNRPEAVSSRRRSVPVGGCRSKRTNNSQEGKLPNKRLRTRSTIFSRLRSGGRRDTLS